LASSGTRILVDTSILIGYLRYGRHRDFIHTALRDGRLLLAGPTLAELYAGATVRADLRDIETIRRSLRPNIIDTDAKQWSLAGRCLANYARRFGRIKPRDHLVDAVVAAAASLIKAVLVTENLVDMARWQAELRRLRQSLLVSSP